MVLSGQRRAPSTEGHLLPIRIVSRSNQEIGIATEGFRGLPQSPQ